MARDFWITTGRLTGSTRPREYLVLHFDIQIALNQSADISILNKLISAKKVYIESYYKFWWHDIGARVMKHAVMKYACIAFWRSIEAGR